jgi:hypothetical protein
MSEIELAIENEIHISGLDEKQNLPKSLQEWLVLPDEWVMELDATQLQNDLLLAERDELVEYVKNLKKLAIYLISKTELSERNLSCINFDMAEKYLPGYLRKEIEINKKFIGIPG